MDFAVFSTLVLICCILFLLYIITKTVKTILFPNPHLPPGSLGWPLIGETIEFKRAALAGAPERFVRDRMEKHDPQIFKTSLLGESCVVFCGPAGNKFLFSNENKMVNVWWPSSVKKLLKSSLISVVGDEAKRMKRMLMSFLDPDALKRYIERIDLITQDHVRTHWEGKMELKVHPTVKLYAFGLVCRLFTSIDDPMQISELEAQFDHVVKGVIEFPINIPGTRFYYAMKAANAIREKLQLTVRQRRAALDKKMLSPAQDFVSHLLMTTDANGRFLSEVEVVDNILLLLYASHDTSKSAITSVMKYLAQFPEVYEKVLREQIDVAKSKETGDLLKWEDIQKMRYSSNVVSEVLRLSPPASGGFREAVVDFTYAGYTIPKGWKLLWNACPAQKDPTVFPKAEDFDASGSEGTGPAPYSYVPFGGGPRMCPGHEFARLEILVFLHSIVKRFKWSLLIPDEKFAYDPMLAPSEGLPIRLQPHQCLP